MLFGAMSRCFILGWRVCAAAAAGPPAGLGSPAPMPADLVVVNGRVWTGVPGAAEFEAIAVSGSRIDAVGSNEQIRPRIGPDTTVIDAAGRRVIPGITDSHTHFLAGGLELSRLDLRPARNKTEFRDRVAAAVARMAPGAWLLGGRWTVDSWENPESPTRYWIDDLTPGTPVFLERMDGHQALVNSVALKFGRIDAKGPPDPPGGEIVRDPKTGEPTGILKDEAMDLVARRIPTPSVDDRCEAVVAAMRHANTFGITCVHDMSQASDLPIFTRVHQANMMTVRIATYVSVEDWKAHIKQYKEFTPCDDWLSVKGLKGFMDGSLGSRTAFMREPFSDAAPDAKYPRGMLLAMADPPEQFAGHVAAAAAAGLQPAIHAIGDEANHLLLDIYEGLDAKLRGAIRPRVEHAQHLLPEDIVRFGRLGVFASMQPFHKADDGRYAESALGHKRCATSYAFKALLDSGATLCFGSDWPVVSISPFAGIATAVDARTLDGKTWFPEQSITREQALRAYTATPALLAGRDKDAGTLEPGKLADIVILSQDVLSIAPDQIAATTATHTIVGGHLVWQLPGSTASPKPQPAHNE